MKNPSLTVILLILILAAIAWTSGRLQKILNAAFGSAK